MPVPSAPFFSQAFSRQLQQDSSADGQYNGDGPMVTTTMRSVLLVNKVNRVMNVTIPAAQGRLFLVDPLSVGNSSADGIREEVVQSAHVELLPFAVGVFEVRS